jgi:hypothetical protein
LSIAFGTANCGRPEKGDGVDFGVKTMRFARWVFLAAGITGVLMMIPPYFLEEQFGRDNPPPVCHPQLYYGFLGITLSWQLMFLVIASDPIRFRLAMLPAMVEKVSFVIAIAILFALKRVNITWVGFASMDATWLVLFIIAYLRTPKKRWLMRDDGGQ